MNLQESQIIDLKARAHLSDIYRRFGKGDSAHCFESLFIWKEDMNLTVTYGDDIYLVKDNSSRETYFFPVGSDTAKKEIIATLLDRGQVRFEYMTDEDVSFTKENFSDRFRFTECPDSSEYIIDRETMQNLPGSSFSKDRGHINRLLKSHVMETRDIHDITKEVLFDIIIGWDASKHMYENIPDECATKNIINNLNELDLEGIVLLMDGVPCSICAGFNLSPDTVDCVIQKNRLSQQGLTYYLRQEYARLQPDSVKFFNWEEDLGIEGLRRAKQLMRPVRMITMYTGTGI